MTDVTPEYLLNVVDEDTALKIWQHLEGMRMYFPKTAIRHYKIKQDYKKMINNCITNAEAIRQLSIKYDMSQSQTRRIISSRFNHSLINS